MLLVVNGCWRSGVVDGQWMLEEWCCCWSVDNGELVLLVVGECWRSSVFGGLWMLEKLCCC